MLLASGGNTEVKPAAVMQHHRPFRLRNLNGREFADPRHC